MICVILLKRSTNTLGICNFPCNLSYIEQFIRMCKRVAISAAEQTACKSTANSYPISRTIKGLN